MSYPDRTALEEQSEIERIARAAYNAFIDHTESLSPGGVRFTWQQLNPQRKARWIAVAQAMHDAQPQFIQLEVDFVDGKPEAVRGRPIPGRVETRHGPNPLDEFKQAHDRLNSRVIRAKRLIHEIEAIEAVKVDQVAALELKGGGRIIADSDGTFHEVLTCGILAAVADRVNLLRQLLPGKGAW